jgi:hypothetical protein
MAGLTSELISARLGRNWAGSKLWFSEKVLTQERIYAGRRMDEDKMTGEPPRKRRRQRREGEDGKEEVPANKKAQKKMENMADPAALPQVHSMMILQD